ncbi:MAG TPA: hypothetical protein VKM69_12525, partial [Natronoarchaeum rubrum]|nr:hypothetical protein [Natronoarchaeum rubrum]
MGHDERTDRTGRTVEASPTRGEQRADGAVRVSESAADAASIPDRSQGWPIVTPDEQGENGGSAGGS